MLGDFFGGFTFLTCLNRLREAIGFASKKTADTKCRHASARRCSQVRCNVELLLRKQRYGLLGDCGLGGCGRFVDDCLQSKNVYKTRGKVKFVRGW